MNQASPEAMQAPPKVAEGDPPTLTVVAGDEQTAILLMGEHGFGVATFDPVAVQLRAGSGEPLAGQPVSWSVGETPANMGVQLDPMGTAPCVVLTDEDGVATLNRMRGNSATAFYDHGPFTLVASHGRATAAVNLNVTPPPAIVPVIVSGDNQSAARTGERVFGGEAVFGPVRFLLQEKDGSPVPGVKVSFEATGPKTMMIRISPEGASAEVVSGEDGTVTLDLMGGNGIVCSGADGEFKIVATPTKTRPVVSHHTVGS